MEVPPISFPPKEGDGAIGFCIVDPGSVDGTGELFIAPPRTEENPPLT